MKMTFPSISVVTAVASALLLQPSADAATLIHRYVFNNNLTDSVGSLNGTATTNNTFLEAPSYVTASPLGATGPTTAIRLGANSGTKDSGFSISGSVLDATAGSISLWLNPATPAGGDTTSDYVIYEPNIGTGMFLTSNPNSNSTLFARVGSGSGLGSTGSDTPGTWINTVITWNTAAGMSFYVNGNLVGNQALSGFSNSAGLRFGNFDLSNVNTFLANQYAGLIYDVQTYSGALNSADVNYLYTHPGQAVPEPSVVALSGLGLAGMLALIRRRHAA